ncbi:MAG: hypothetical protein PHG30_09590 [Eubacteriales bacterium]|nr:hypothetical protein [Eubacteriales bacterium]MDD3951126.1 hypothetical protein [Desulfobacterales bacterium]
MLKLIDDLPGMNVCSTTLRLEGDVNVVEFTPSPGGGLERLWFYFALANIGSGGIPRTTRLILKNINTMLGGESGDFQPVIRYSGREWQRLPHAGIITRGDGYISMSWEIKTPAEAVEIAFCYPYGHDELERLLADTGGYWHGDEIGVSSAGLPLLRLSNNYGSQTARTHGYYLVTRQHAMETSGAWVLDGIMRRLAETVVDFPVWVVPCANPDDAAAGHYGKNPFPWDINRAWGPHAPMRHEAATIIHDLKMWRAQVAADSMIIDLHSPGADEKGLYVFTHRYIPPEWPVHAQLEKLEQRLGAFASSQFFCHADYQQYSAWGDCWNLGQYATHTLEMPQFTLETSYYHAAGHTLELTDYRRIGEILADWMTETNSQQ